MPLTQIGFAPLPAHAVSTEWRQTDFLGGPAWESVNGALRAVVCPARSRLLYFGTSDGSLNLLSCPEQAPAPESGKDAPNWGGHRFWLGPQQRWIWPPIKDWEFSAAAIVQVVGQALRMQHPRTRADYPALNREYVWEGERLRCSVAWHDDGRLYYGMHVVAVDAPAEVPLELHKSEERPAGLVAVSIEGYDASGMGGHPAYTEAEGRGWLRSGSERMAKAGVAPQALTIARRAGWQLSLQPGTERGVRVGVSDSGFLSQVWVGDGQSQFAELEQLSGFLSGDKDGWCASTCYLAARRA